MKECTKCNTIKPFEQFHKKKAGIDGHQNNCKVCHNAYTERYRKEIRPDYWNSKDGYFSHRKNWEYIAEYRAANKNILVYMIKVLDYFYIGMTKARLNVRINTHRADYKNPKKHGSMPGLHNMFDKLSQSEIDNALSTTVVLESKAGNRYEGYKCEEKWIKFYSDRGWNLLNDKHHQRNTI